MNSDLVILGTAESSAKFQGLVEMQKGNEIYYLFADFLESLFTDQFITFFVFIFVWEYAPVIDLELAFWFWFLS